MVVRYALRRVFGSLLVLIGVTLITFILSHVLTDPITVGYGNRVPPAQKEILKKQLGLNEPLPFQYVSYLLNVAHGDLGRSYRTNTPVWDSILTALPNTLILALGGLGAELVLGISIGIIAATRCGSILDRAIELFLLINLSLPTFWLGLVLLYIFAFVLKWFPLGGNTQFSSFILPILTIGMGGAVFYARLLRNQLLEELNSDYTRTARAKGLQSRAVLTRHVLRNALIPIVTWAGLDLGAFLGGVVVVEAVYSLNGIGKLAVSALANVDIPVILGTVLISAVLIVVVNLCIDLLYPVLDPRIRL